MRVLFIVPRFHTNLFFATKALVTHGHDVSMFCDLLAPLEDYSYVTPTALKHDDLTLSNIWKLLSETKPDLILLRHTEGRWKRFLWLALLRGIKTVGYDQRPSNYQPPLYKRLAAILRGKPLRRISPVPALAGDYTQPNFIPFPIDLLPAAAERDYLPKNVLRILCVAKLSQKRKRHTDVVEAVKNLPQDQQIQITFVGASVVETVSGASADHQRKLFTHAGQHDNISIDIRADLPFAEVTDLYSQYDICVLPAENESLGSAPLEAMAAGTVPIITDNCGSTGYLTHGVNGFIYPVGDIKALTMILAELCNSDKLRATGKNAAHLVATELSPAAYVKRMQALRD